MTPGAYNTTDGEGIFVTKLNPGGSQLVYSTYLFPGNGSSAGIAVDALGDAYVVGHIYNTAFPVTPNAFQPTFGGGFNIVTVSNTGNVDSTGGVVSLASGSPFTLTSASPPGLANAAPGSLGDFEVWPS